MRASKSRFITQMATHVPGAWILAGAWSVAAIALSSCEGSDDDGDSQKNESALCTIAAGGASSSPSDEEERFVQEPDDEIAFLYDQDELRTFEIKISEENLARLDGDPTAEEYVEATFVYEEVEYPVSVRYKGSFGAWVLCVENSTESDFGNVTGPKSCPKLSLKVSFNEEDPAGLFFGVKKLLFHAMNLDPSLMRERLGYKLFRDMGVAAPRAVHARLMINGEYAGVFLNLEYIDGRFTRSRFEDGDGNLFKEVWPAASSLQPAVTDQRLLAGLRTNEDEEPDVSRVVEFAELINSEDGDIRAEGLRSWMNLDYLARFMAVDRAIRADDGPVHFYCSGGRCNNHNFYLYSEEKADRLWLVPWDLDNAFTVPGQGVADDFVSVVQEWDDHEVTCAPENGRLPIANRQMPPSCDPLFNTLGCGFHSVFDDATAELLSGPFSEEAVRAQLDLWSAQIEDAVEEAHSDNPAQLAPEAWAAAKEDFLWRIELLREQAADF